MVQTIKRNTYRCRLCKNIHSSMKRALECEEDCLDEKNYEMIPTMATMKIDGKKHKIWLGRRVRKLTDSDKSVIKSIQQRYTKGGKQHEM